MMTLEEMHSELARACARSKQLKDELGQSDEHCSTLLRQIQLRERSIHSSVYRELGMSFDGGDP